MDSINFKDIPPADHKMWKELVSSGTSHQFKNFAFQLTVHTVKTQLSLGQQTEEEAINKLRQMCIKFPKVSIEDLRIIFKDWYL